MRFDLDRGRILLSDDEPQLLVPASVLVSLATGAMGARDVGRVLGGTLLARIAARLQRSAEGEAAPSDTLSSSELPAPVTVPKVQMALLADLHPEIPRPEESRATQSACDGLLTTTAPPEVRTTWCFVSRTALPARAPSVFA